MSSLVIPWEASDERAVQLQLHELDPHLILTRERDHLGRDYYVVIYYTNGTVPPDLVVDWRDAMDVPKPLSSGLVYEIQRMMSEGPPDMEKIRRHNEALRAQRNQESAEMLEEIAKDFDRYRRIGNFMVVPRSRALYLARSRGRRRGVAS